jgi:hypothetical protein
VLLGVPREGRDPVALLDAELPQAGAQPVDALGHLGVARAAQAVVGQGDDLPVAVHTAHPLEHVSQRQRIIVLHQSLEHLPLLSRG